ncbi:MAG: hypothetical protein ACODAU_01205 [Myxococcota bacterium]
MPRIAPTPRQTLGALAIAAGLIGAQNTPPTPVHAQQEDGPPPTIGPRHTMHTHRHAVYEPTFALDQRARATVRCLGFAQERVGPGRRRQTLLRFEIGLDNTTDDDMELVDDALYLDWARHRRVPERGVRARELEGPTELAPGERGRVQVRFRVRTDDPEEVSVIRLRWSLRSDAGSILLLRSVFVRRGPASPFLFAPHYDPFGNLGVIGPKRFR